MKYAAEREAVQNRSDAKQEITKQKNAPLTSKHNGSAANLQGALLAGHGDAGRQRAADCPPLGRSTSDAPERNSYLPF